MKRIKYLHTGISIILILHRRLSKQTAQRHTTVVYVFKQKVQFSSVISTLRMITMSPREQDVDCSRPARPSMNKFTRADGLDRRCRHEQVYGYSRSKMIDDVPEPEAWRLPTGMQSSDKYCGSLLCRCQTLR